MTLIEVQQEAERIWENNSPSEISSFNQEKNSFVEAFVEGYKFGKFETKSNLLSKLLSNDESEHPKILKNLIKELFNKPDSYVDCVKDIQVVEHIEFTFSIREFCELIDLSLTEI